MSASGFKNQCSRPRFEPVLLASDDACNLQVSDVWECTWAMLLCCSCLVHFSCFPVLSDEREVSSQAVKSTPQDKREKGYLCATKILHHVRKGIISGKQEGCSENEGTLGISALAAKMKVRWGIQLLQWKWKYAWEVNSCSENEGTLGNSTLAVKMKVRLGIQLLQRKWRYAWELNSISFSQRIQMASRS